jgi:hypothetical protein
MFEAVITVFFLLSGSLVSLLVVTSVSALATGSPIVVLALFMGNLLLLTSALDSFALLARGLGLVDLDLLGEFLLKLWEIFVSLRVILVLPRKKSLEGAGEFGRTL